MSPQDEKKNNKVTALLYILVVLALIGYNLLPEPKSKVVDTSVPISIPVSISTSLSPIANKINIEPIFKDLLGRAELSYAGGTEGRNKNIEIGISKINGIILRPGEEFSFTKVLGPVTAEDGYSEERIFLNGEVTKGLGGGLCQVSTILFQSAINSGLPITERHSHSFSVALYDVGLDATYADPGPDLKFINDTANPITIKGWTEDHKAIFEIYGISDGRIASTTEAKITNVVDFLPTKYVFNLLREKDAPKCINTPQIGYTAEIKYNILYATGERKEQTFTSKYNPLQRICFLDLDELNNFGRTIWN